MRAVCLFSFFLIAASLPAQAKELPEQTRCVITLGTPFSGHPKSTNAWRLYELLSGQNVDGHVASILI